LCAERRLVLVLANDDCSIRAGMASRVKEVIIIVDTRVSSVHYRVLIVTISLGRHKSETDTLKIVVSGSVLLHHTGATFYRNISGTQQPNI
jgi:outer membrane usher protein FimD/PapC